MRLSVIITSAYEEKTISQAVEQIIKPNKPLWADMEVLVIAPDNPTLEAATKVAAKYSNFNNFHTIKDPAYGKPSAVNMAVDRARGDIVVFTDGDMYIGDSAIELILKQFENPDVGGVSGHPISLDDRAGFWGFSSHLFCHGAHSERTRNPQITPMSGYLYAIKMTNDIKNIFPIQKNLRAEDAYISKRINKLGYQIAYEPDALAYVHFPKNLGDWINQKKRSLGGNIQIAQTIQTGAAPEKGRKDKQFGKNKRSLRQDLSYFYLPFNFATNPKEYLYALLIYPLRLYLWIIIYIQHTTKSYSRGTWERIESSKG